MIDLALPHLAEWDRNTEKVEMLPPVNVEEASKQTFTVPEKL